MGNKQTILGGIEEIELEQLQIEIDKLVKSITDKMHSTIDLSSVCEKRNSIQSLKLILAAISGLKYLRDHSNNQGVVTISRTKFTTNEKIQAKARSKKSIEGPHGKIIERVTSEIKIIDEAFSSISWQLKYVIIKE